MDEEEFITITERDMKREEGGIVCINLEKNIWVRFGFPMNEEGLIDNKFMKNLSGPPYVFTVNKLVLIDEESPEGVELEDIKVIFMHGGREKGGEWMFSSLKDGYPVVETVREVNKYLKSRGEGTVEVVMACNRNHEESDIQIGDFPSEDSVVYAVGESVKLRKGEMSEGGAIRWEARAKDFWNLQHLKNVKNIKVLE